MSPFLKRCQCTRGFFTLRACDLPAPHTCPACQRLICDEHWSSDSGGSAPAPVPEPAPAPPESSTTAAASGPGRCVECAARADEERTVDDRFDSLWFHRYRHRYYSSHHYRPVYYFGDRFDPYYNDRDFRFFQQTDAGAQNAAGALDDDDGPAGGLGDS